MNDLKAYVQQRLESFNESLVECFETTSTEIIEEMQEVMNKLKSADEDAKVAVKLKEEMLEELNFINAHQKQVELLLTNPFDKR